MNKVKSADFFCNICNKTYMSLITNSLRVAEIFILLQKRDFQLYFFATKGVFFFATSSDMGVILD